MLPQRDATSASILRRCLQSLFMNVTDGPLWGTAETSDFRQGQDPSCQLVRPS
jgi:hypothetical protein